jgi:CubicO group peptidase (beta-lactamase class C family)
MALALAACVPEQPPAVAAAPARAMTDAERAQAYPIGAAADYWRPATIIGSFSAMDRIFTARPIAAAPRPLPLRATPPGPPLAVSFTHAGRNWTLDSYLEGTATTAFLALRRDGTVLVERYLHQRRPEDRLTSWSMAKTVTAILVGLALADGRIASLDDPAGRYVPGLAGSAYAEVPIRHLLTMASGVGFNETYDAPGTDIARLALASFQGQGRGGVASVNWITARAAEPGTRFNYASADTQVLGLVLAAATGQSVAAMTEARIWQPMGAEAAASWLIDAAGQEATFCCMNVTLRDFGRLGLLMANQGRALDGRQVLPADWVRVMGERLAPGAPGGGYGYQTWVGNDPNYAVFRGVHGQWIIVDRGSGIVIVRTAALAQSSSPEDAALTAAMARALIARATGGS